MPDHPHSQDISAKGREVRGGDTLCTYMGPKPPMGTHRWGLWGGIFGLPIRTHRFSTGRLLPPAVLAATPAARHASMEQTAAPHHCTHVHKGSAPLALLAAQVHLCPLRAWRDGRGGPGAWEAHPQPAHDQRPGAYCVLRVCSDAARYLFFLAASDGGAGGRLAVQQQGVAAALQHPGSCSLHPKALAAPASAQCTFFHPLHPRPQLVAPPPHARRRAVSSTT